MGASSREEIVEVFGALDTALDRLGELSFEVLTTPERLRALELLECAARRLRAPQHTLINQVGAQACAEELGGSLRTALADRLRITRAEATRRIDDADDLGERRALTGQPLAPRLAATATAQRAGLIGDGHVRVIRGFFAHLPAEVDLSIREAADADLAKHAAHYRPDELARYAQRIMDWLHPDGDFSDQERARKRGIILGKQEYDGMSRISGMITPELRAAIEAMLAKLAAPGACNPDDQTPIVDAAPDEEAVRRDHRTAAQRNHDALLAALRGLFASGELGRHNGLPVSIIVSATLRELEAAAGKALTAGGTLVPMSDVIRWAGHAHHYLALFDGAKPLALYHTRRLASPAQRIMLYAKDRGCTKPGCDAPAYHSQVHHVKGWTNTRRTDIDDLGLACGPDNRLIEKGWTTRTNTRGETEWIPPPHLDRGQPRTNSFHHPERFLRGQDDDEPH
ncbi:HNH endonuclease signature motif containing protein [Mycobacterium sp. 663a-19]|uniref:HNH endonuclease signature motif containing protein n=1 Tax=Mycobacterium sp. 663a-19 TaxID=2986148 RepID=UPI002D1E811E|nr:HNH endonuclease signature motif containing protein [Mycobacterium sp. 663a-19]MEB3983281.1 HNH endonuclease signature motif containing protein [Mycobacterium sp. 663a-19]